MQAVVIAAGDLDPADLELLGGADLVVAADGGASAAAVGRTPDVVVGDLDSADAGLVDRLEAAGTLVQRYSEDKDASDTELAVERAAGSGAVRISVLGALGGARLDHQLATLLLLTDPAWRGRDVRIVHGGITVRALHGGEELQLDAGVGDLVTLLPVGGDAEGVRTSGLRWSLDGETLRMGRSRGLSNRVVAAPASVRLEHGVLLVIETASQGVNS